MSHVRQLLKVIAVALCFSVEANATVIQNGLIGYWAGDGNTNDSSPNHNNGGAVGGLSYVPGISGQAFNFANGGMGAADIPAYSFGPDITFGFWIYGDSPGTYFGQDPGAGLNEKWFLAIGYPTAGSFDFHINHPAGPISYIGPPETIPLNPNSWNHLAFVKNGDTFLFYVNGQLDGTQTVPGIVMADPPGFQAGLNFGQYQEPCCGYLGLMDEIVIYDRALSAQEVSTLAAVDAVPEPATLALLGLGLAGLGISRRRKPVQA